MLDFKLHNQNGVERMVHSTHQLPTGMYYPPNNEHEKCTINSLIHTTLYTHKWLYLNLSYLLATLMTKIYMVNSLITKYVPLTQLSMRLEEGKI